MLLTDLYFKFIANDIAIVFLCVCLNSTSITISVFIGRQAGRNCLELDFFVCHVSAKLVYNR